MHAIQLNATRVTDKETIKGIEFEVGISPYYFPEEVVPSINALEGKFVIQCKYGIDDDEGTVEVDDDPQDALHFFVGKRSGRLLRIEIDVDKHDLDHVAMTLTKKLDPVVDRFEGASKPFRGFKPTLEAISLQATDIANAALA